MFIHYTFSCIVTFIIINYLIKNGPNETINSTWYWKRTLSHYRQILLNKNLIYLQENLEFLFFMHLIIFSLHCVFTLKENFANAGILKFVEMSVTLFYFKRFTFEDVTLFSFVTYNKLLKYIYFILLFHMIRDLFSHLFLF